MGPKWAICVRVTHHFVFDLTNNSVDWINHANLATTINMKADWYSSLSSIYWHYRPKSLFTESFSSHLKVLLDTRKNFDKTKMGKPRVGNHSDSFVTRNTKLDFVQCWRDAARFYFPQCHSIAQSHEQVVLPSPTGEQRGKGIHDIDSVTWILTRQCNLPKVYCDTATNVE